MENGGYQPQQKRRKRRCVIVTVACVLLLIIIIVAVVFVLKRRQNEDSVTSTFIARCEGYEGLHQFGDTLDPHSYDCQKIWKVFEQAYVGKDPCKVPTEAYDPLIASAPFQPACNRMMFWSKTKDVVHDFTEKTKCFLTLEDSLLGSVLDGLTWCGKESSSETFTTGCPGWTDCENNPVRSFWVRASAAFADVACGDVTAMLNGSITTPFSPTSIFGSIEVKRFNSTRVKSLNVVLVTQMNNVANCTNPSFKDLQETLDKGIKYNCKEVAESQIQECSSKPDIACGSCW
ncbi:ADP-ribosyl cyclase/cyclic ADP-ribose hydrolase 1-like [Toxotes jaculatrix]|uniref:ADP-ribosyl cyclase/cyclic ADP-ribose hydrolase 1-like n=1 Tax=Toxotes jaculatrix TaxID=941984 RepID=UPI001B3AB328|nr:ADP-ribosyl cyclase/cyclic ADP-ribose hydrolase 1-like [Toxotes jaculatrix]